MSDIITGFMTLLFIIGLILMTIYFMSNKNECESNVLPVPSSTLEEGINKGRKP